MKQNVEEVKKILVCEDDENLGMLITEYLQIKGFETTLCENGENGYMAFLKKAYDVCILDIMMPKKDGLTLAADIRQINSEVPIIFVTAKNLKEDVIEGFRHGCDDYITKPFSMEELLCRMEAILRRISQKRQADKYIYRLGKYTFDSQKQQLIFEEDNEITKLTTKEAELMSLLCANVNDILERNVTLKSIWIDDNYFNARSMDVYITKLRKLLRRDDAVQIINIHGRGYKLIAPSVKKEKC